LMATSKVLRAKRALVALLRSLAVAYNLVVNCNRDSDDKVVLTAFKKVSLRVHPDHGGSTVHQQQLNDARAAWDEARERKDPGGRRPAGQPHDPAGQDDPNGIALQILEGDGGKDKGNRQQYRVKSQAALLTYMGVSGDLAEWGRFCDFARGSLKRWGVKHWGATMEKTKEGKPHYHLMLQFHRQVDRTTAAFVFEGHRPNANATDLCGEGLCRKKLQQCINRGFFYVFADKEGTCTNEDGTPCVAGNYGPVWSQERFTYQVLGAWPEKLWKQRKLSTGKYRKYLYLTRDGVAGRLRNLDLVEAEEARAELEDEMARNIKRIRSNPAVYTPFPTDDEAAAWLKCFEVDALRYPILIVLGPSHSAKTEWAKALFVAPLELKVGKLNQFPDLLRTFDRKVHDAIVLDDIRDLAFLADVQDKLQGKYDALLEFGTTPGGQCNYTKYLFKVPIVATANYSTANLGYLASHDWLGNAQNRTVIERANFAPQ